MDLKGLLWSGSGSDSFDDREPQVRISLAANAPLPLHHRRASAGGFCGWLAGLVPESISSALRLSRCTDRGSRKIKRLFESYSCFLLTFCRAGYALAAS